MIAWAGEVSILNGAKVLLCFNSNLKPVASMIELGDDWLVQNGTLAPFQIKGKGCPDPIEFMFKLVSPRKADIESDTPFLEFTNSESGERWEVWEVK